MVITSGWIWTRCAAGHWRLGLRLRPGHSSLSDVSDVAGMSLPDQADMLVSEGVEASAYARWAETLVSDCACGWAKGLSWCCF